MNLHFDQPLMLLLALAIVPMVGLGWRWLRVMDPLRRITVLGIRSTLLAILAVALARFNILSVETGMVSAAALVPAAADEICSQTADIFDGERRWAIEIGPPRHEGGDGGGGDRIRCDAVYVRIAGFKPKLMGERARRPFALFFEDRGDGLFHVVRAAGKTSFGLAVLLLRE